MWTVVYMAQNYELAIDTQKMLNNEGILAQLRQAKKYKNSEDSCYEILVPAGEVNEAHDLIVEQGK